MATVVLAPQAIVSKGINGTVVREFATKLDSCLRIGFSKYELRT